MILIPISDSSLICTVPVQCAVTYCCCCDSPAPAALLLSSVVQVEEVCDCSRVDP